MSKSRIEAFTDAVIAIIMTILVLNLVPPAESNFPALWRMRYSFLVYLISFLSLAVYWNNHHHLFQISKRISGGILWLNTLFLFCLSLFPFATSWVDKNLNQQVPELIYGLVVMAANLTYMLLARGLVKLNGPKSHVARALAGYRKSKITLAINGAALLLGLVFPPAVMILCSLTMLLWVVPERRIEQAFWQMEDEI